MWHAGREFDADSSRTFRDPLVSVVATSHLKVRGSPPLLRKLRNLWPCNEAEEQPCKIDHLGYRIGRFSQLAALRSWAFLKLGLAARIDWPSQVPCGCSPRGGFSRGWPCPGSLPSAVSSGEPSKGSATSPALGESGATESPRAEGETQTVRKLCAKPWKLLAGDTRARILTWDAPLGIFIDPDSPVALAFTTPLKVAEPAACALKRGLPLLRSGPRWLLSANGSGFEGELG